MSEPETEALPRPRRKPSNKQNTKPKPKGERKKPKPAFACEFCKMAIRTEANLMKHACEPKRRYIRRDDKPVKIGLMAYTRYLERAMRYTKPVSYDNFAKNSLYSSFVAFGRYLMDIQALNPMRFIDFLIRVEAPLDRWKHPTLYETYVRELSKNENPIDALERQILLMQQWSIDSGEDWTQFFHKVAPGQAVTWIQSGRLSPWLLFTASTAELLMSRLSTEQAAIVEKSIDAGFWIIKLERNKDAVEHIKTTLNLAGI